MREILFRGKRKDYGENGEWVYGYLNQHRGDSIFDACYETIYGGDFYIRDWLEKIDTGLYGLDYKIAPETIGQYTGLSDKNGVKIFEGDIIKTNKYGKIVGHSNVNDYDIFMVIYVPCTFRLINKTRGFNLVDDGYSKLEVIGNIHDNPELMGGKQNADKQ